MNQQEKQNMSDNSHHLGRKTKQGEKQEKKIIFLYTSSKEPSYQDPAYINLECASTAIINSQMSLYHEDGDPTKAD